jgi:hypothetical protein
MKDKPTPHLKLDKDSGGNLRVRIDKNRGLNKKERLELVDLLRKNMVYQTPKPIFADVSDEHPTWVEMRFVFVHQQRILELLHKAGGWVLPPDDKQAILRKHEEKSREAFGNGVDYDLSHLSYGDLVEMLNELAVVKGDPALDRFREAIRAELKHQDEGAYDG